MGNRILIALISTLFLTSCANNDFEPEALELVTSACADWEQMKIKPGYGDRVQLLDGISDKLASAALIEDSAKLLVLSNYASNSANTSTNLPKNQASAITEFCLALDK
jgi:hypothetical protein